MIKQILTIACIGLVAFTSCKKKGCTDSKATNYSAEAKKDDGSCTYAIDNGGISLPTKYEFTDAAGNNTVSYSGQSERLEQLRQMTTLMKTGTSTILNAAVLKDMFANTGDNGNGNFDFTSTKQLENKCFPTDVDVFKQLMDSLAFISQSYMQTASNGQAGVVTSGTSNYLVSQNGIEYTQIIEKGLMGAVFMYQATNVYFGDSKMDVDNTLAVDAAAGKYYTAMEHHFDEAFGYFGVATDFPTTLPNDFWGKYCNSQNAEIQSNKVMMDAFIAGRYAISNKNITDRNAAIKSAREMWEKISARQAITYINDAISNLGTDNAKMLHQLSEAYAFVWNLRYAPSETRVLSQTEVTALIAQFGDNFWDLTLPELNAIKASLEAAY